MNKRIKVFLRVTLLLLLAIFLGQSILPASASAEEAAKEHLAVILILDDSGSMSSNDPASLRYVAAQLFVALLDEGDAVGALRFSNNSRGITDGIEIITGPDKQTQLVESLSQTVPDGYTDVKAAFLEAHNMLQAFNRAEHQVAVVFLTDGKPEIPQPYEGYEQESVEIAKQLNAPVLSIALTKTGQTGFLNQVASQTNGQVIFAEEATDLLDIYLQLLGDLKDRTVIAASVHNTSDNLQIQLDPALMPYVDRVSFVISQPASSSAELFAPDGQRLTKNDPGVLMSIQNSRFSVLTVSKPSGGDWYFQRSGTGATYVRAILYTRLRAHLVSPANSFEAGRPVPLVVRLVEAQPGSEPITIIGQASFSAQIIQPNNVQESLDQFYDDGTHGDMKAGDGLFTRLYVNTEQVGTYQIEIQGFKGTVPVTAHTRLQAAPFPQMVLDQPALRQYDIRTDSIPLEFHLEGDPVSELDRGHFIAEIITPDGGSLEVPLVFTDGRYHGEFMPAQDGGHQIIIKPVDALYQNLPYDHTLEVNLEVRIIPTIAAKISQVGSTPSSGEDIPRIELSQAKTGVPVLLSFSSTSSKTEEVPVWFEGAPGFSLLESAVQVAANQASTARLILVADRTLSAQTVDGLLRFAAPEGVDFIGGTVSVSFEVFQPQLSFEPTITSEASSESCLVWAPVQLTLSLSLESDQSEQVQVQIAGLEAATLTQEVFSIPPGNSQLELTLFPESGSFSAGEYQGTLSIIPLREDLPLSGQAIYPISFIVDPVWVSCREPLIFLGLGSVIAFIILVKVVTSARRAGRPPAVTGTIVYWNQRTPDMTMNIDLTALNKKEVTIGKGKSNDIVVPDEAVQEAHARILAERDPNGEIRFILEPIASIRKGYRSYTSPLPLEENVQYQLGEHSFIFIRDLNL